MIIQGKDKVNNALLSTNRNCSPENLIRLCLSADFDNPSMFSSVESYTECDLDWNQILEEASKNGLHLILDKLLKILSKGDNPPLKISRTLGRIARFENVANLMHEAVLKDILDMASEISVPVLVPKGIFLTNYIYATKDLRPVGDLDIFVREQDLHKIYNHLLDTGFHSTVNNHGLALIDRNFKRVFIELQTFESSQKNRFRERALINIDETWDSITRFDLFSKKGYAMKAEHLLIYLGIHFAERHTFQRLIWLRDIKEVIDYYENNLDWDYLIECIRDWRAATSMYFTLLAAQVLTETEIPENVLLELRPKYLNGRLFENQFLKRSIFQMHLQPTSWRYQLWSVLGDKLSQRIWAQVALPYHLAKRIRSIK